MYNKKRIELIVKDWVKLKTGLELSDETISQMVADITETKQCDIPSVVKSLPTKEDAVAEGYRIAKDAGYNYRRVLKSLDQDIYYSGWMDCYDWMTR